MMEIKNEKLDRRITIQRYVIASRDAFNEPVYVWSDLVVASASKEDVRDAERVAAQEVGADITTRFQVRWTEVLSTVNAKDRVLYEGQVYSIVGTKELGRRRGIEITAVARADE